MLKSFEREARRRGIPVSHLINQTLRTYITRDKYFEELGFLPLSKDLIRKVLSRIEEKYLIEDAKEFGLTLMKEYISYFFVDVNTNTLLEFLDLWLSRFAYRHRIDYKQHSYCVNHDLGMSYSIFFREYIKALIERIINSPVRFSATGPSTLTFSFETS